MHTVSCGLWLGRGFWKRDQILGTQNPLARRSFSNGLRRFLSSFCRFRSFRDKYGFLLLILPRAILYQQRSAKH